MGAILEETRVYVGTYAKYNNGSIEGKWLSLGDYNDLEEFYEECRELHDDEQDPEFMFQDYEVHEFLKGKINESSIDGDVYEIAEALESLEDLNDDEWVSLHNEYCSNVGSDDTLYNFDEEFFEVFFSGKLMDAVRATHFGKLNWSDDYIYFNGYGNLESTCRPLDMIDKGAIIEDYLENSRNYSI